MATLNYLYPVNGAVPSAKAVSTVSKVTVQLITTTADTQVLVTHNMNISAADQANGWPHDDIQWTVPPTSTAGYPGFVNGTNVLTINFVGGTGAAGTGILTIDRPFTMSR